MRSKRRRPGELPHLSDELMRDLTDALRGWYFTRRRRLPWRDEPTAYRVWVSEIMLQQTQVATVIPYFERFLAAFPTVEALAAAPEDAVLGLWSGLGYYRRARNLHAGAKLVSAELGGTIPNSVDGLLKIPGIGRYTAGAIASIAFGVRAPLLDGNVARVLSRVFAIDEPVDGSAGLVQLWGLADALVPAADPSSHNQALMELGALVCSPRDPACGECPLADRCRALAKGAPTAYPKKKKKAAPQPVLAVAGLCRRAIEGCEQVLFAQRPDGLLGGLWELPGGEMDLHALESEETELAALFRERTGLNVDVGQKVATVLHQFSHRSLTLQIYEVTRRSDAEPAAASGHYPALRWLEPATVGGVVPLSTLTRKVLAASLGPAAVPAESTGPKKSKPPRAGRGLRTTAPELPL